MIQKLKNIKKKKYKQKNKKIIIYKLNKIIINILY